MSDMDHTERSTSILELMYLIRAKNNGEMSFSEWMGYASQWARDVIAESEAGQIGSTPPIEPTQPLQDCH